MEKQNIFLYIIVDNPKVEAENSSYIMSAAQTEGLQLAKV